MLLEGTVFDVCLSELVERPQQEVGLKLTQAAVQSSKLILSILRQVTEELFVDRVKWFLSTNAQLYGKPHSNGLPQSESVFQLTGTLGLKLKPSH